MFSIGIWSAHTDILFHVKPTYQRLERVAILTSMPKRRGNGNSKPNDEMANSKQVKINPAFGNPISPKPIIEKVAKAISTKPMKLLPAQPGTKMQLRPGVQLQLERQGNKGGNKVKQKQQELSSSLSSSTTATSTPSPTTSTTSEKSTSTTKQYTTSTQMPRDRTTSRGGNDRSSGNSRGTSGPGRDERPSRDRSTYPAEHTEFNAMETGAGYYQPKPQDNGVPWMLTVKDTTYLDTYKPSTNLGNELKHGFTYNISSLAEGLNCTADSNPVVYAKLQSIWFKQQSDVINATRGSLVNSYTFTEWQAAIVAAARLLEIYFCLDSAQSQIPQNSDVDETNRTVEKYTSFFKTGELYDLRAEIATVLRATWLPSNFSAGIRWFFQFYKVGDLPQCDAYKFICSEQFLIVDGKLYGASGTDQTAGLRTLIKFNIAEVQKYSKIFAVQVNCYPTSAINSIPPSCGKIIYDRRHEEIYVNDSLVYRKPGDTKDRTWPEHIRISDAEANVYNTVMYIMNRNPQLNSDDGLPFAMQSMIRVQRAANPANSFVETNSVRQGIRVNKAVAGDSFNGFTTANKFTFVEGRYSYPRLGNSRVTDGTPDCHKVYLIDASEIKYSKCNTGYQQVELNSFIAVQQCINILLDKMFNMIPQQRD